MPPHVRTRGAASSFGAVSIWNRDAIPHPFVLSEVEAQATGQCVRGISFGCAQDEWVVFA
jgi:hypothetical protein